MKARKAISLIEIISVVAVLFVLIGLILPAVQKVREAAARVNNLDKLKQITLATHTIESQRGSVPGVFGKYIQNQGQVGPNLFFDLMEILNVSFHSMNFFLNPNDPSYHNRVDPNPLFPVNTKKNSFTGCSSYALNAQIGAREQFQISNDITDGTSNTIFFSERYSYRCNGIIFSISQYSSRSNYHGVRRCMFAESPIADEDSDLETELDHDVYPITLGAQSLSIPSRVGQTFQVRPKVIQFQFSSNYPPDDCDPRRVQASQTSGLAVSFADGSARLIRPSVDPLLFWGAITPHGGEVFGLD
jgi:hypothetical protein